MPEPRSNDWRNGVNRDLGALCEAVSIMQGELRDFRRYVEGRFERLEEKIDSHSAFINISKGKAMAYASILATLGGVAGALAAVLLK